MAMALCCKLLPVTDYLSMQVLVVVLVLFPLPAVCAMNLVVDVPILLPMRVVVTARELGMFHLLLAFRFTGSISHAPVYSFSIPIPS
jgi:hypothetical protein